MFMWKISDWNVFEELIFPKKDILLPYFSHFLKPDKASFYQK